MEVGRWPPTKAGVGLPRVLERACRDLLEPVDKTVVAEQLVEPAQPVQPVELVEAAMAPDSKRQYQRATASE